MTLRGPAIAAIVVVVAIAAYFVLALRLPQHVAFALASFGACIAGMFIFALRTAFEDRRRHDHAD